MFLPRNLLTMDYPPICIQQKPEILLFCAKVNFFP